MYLFRLAAWPLLALLGLLGVLPQGSTRVFTWPWAFYAQVLMVAPILLAGWQTITTASARGRGGVALALLAVSSALSVGLSRNPHFSFEAALYLWSGLAFVWWLSHRLREASADDGRLLYLGRVAGAMMAAPVLSSFFFWCLLLQPGLAAAGTFSEVTAALGRVRNFQPFGHPNYVGAFALIVFPCFGALAAVERGRGRAAWIAASVLAVALIFSSGSRGAVLGMFALLLTAFALALFTARISRRTGLWLLVGGVGVAVFLVFTNARLRSIFTDSSALRYPGFGDVQRLGMLQGGVLLAQQRPWVGHGPGMVPFVYPEVRGQVVGGVETSYQLHNAYVHQWATTGVLGLAAGLILAAALVAGARGWLRQKSGPARTFALGSAASLAGYAVMAATDYQLYVIALVAALSVPTAFLLAAPNSPHRQDGQGGTRARLASGILLIVGGLVCVAILVPHWRARELHWSAWVSAEPDLARPTLKLREAAEAAPWNTHYRNQLGLLLAREAQQSNHAAQRHLARTELLASVQIDAAQEPIHANLGWLWLPDDPVQAAAAFRRALTLIPDRDTVHYGLALSLLATGDTRGAIDALALESLVNPPFIGAPLWAEPRFVALKKPVNARLKELLEQARSHPALPFWRQRDLIYFQAVLRWWEGGSAPAGDELFGADADQRAFFTAAASTSQAEATWPAPWRELAELANRTRRSSLPGEGREQAVRAGALARLDVAKGPIPELVRSATPGSVGVMQYLLERRHFPLMHRNLDATGYLDLAPHIVDAFRQRYLDPLLPARGLIPGPVLADLAPTSDSPGH